MMLNNQGNNLNYLNYIVFPLIGLDSLDFCEPASKEVLFLVSVSIRVIRGQLYFLAAEHVGESEELSMLSS